MHSLNSNPRHHPIQKLGTDAGQQGISHVGWATALSLPNIFNRKKYNIDTWPNAQYIPFQHGNVGYKKHVPHGANGLAGFRPTHLTSSTPSYCYSIFIDFK